MPIIRTPLMMSDPETGCVSTDQVALESCRQAYFLKQQNQILQGSPKTKIATTTDQALKANQDLLSENTALKEQLRTSAVKYNNLIAQTIQQQQQCIPDEMQLFTQSLLSYQTLSMLLGIALTILIYFLYKSKWKHPK